MATKKTPEPADPTEAEPTTEQMRAAVMRTLFNTVEAAGKKRHVRFVCEHHPKFDPKKSPAGVVPQGKNSNSNWYHEIDVFVPDSAVIAAAKELLDRLDGKAAAQKPVAPTPKFDGGSLEDLTDEELAALAANDRSDG